MATVDAILFDKDGTLFDFHATWGGWAKRFLLDICAGDERRARGLAAAARFDFDRARYLPDSPLIASTPGQIAACLIPHLPEFTSQLLIERMNTLSAEAEQVEATPLGPLLFELRERALKLGVVTNDSLGATEAHLRRSGVVGLFDRMLGCDSGFLPKPEPDMLLAFCEFVDVEPANVAMVGDSPGDLIAARRAGMVPVAVLTGPVGRDTLEPIADVVLPSIAQIPAWLDGAQTKAA
ncbi:MAG: HAD family hydrolase [Rhodobacteraceae bacterium]|nr:HAD family hydrolase [Paracoccaceae bacterium]